MALALASLCAVLLLVLIRIVRERNKRRAAIRQENIRLLLNRALASSYDFVAGPLHQAATRDPQSLITVAADLLRNLRGTDERRLTTMLQDCGLLPVLRRTVYHGHRSLRIRAISVLSHFDKEQAAGALGDQVLDPDPDIGLAALRGLVMVQAYPSLDEVLRPLLARGSNLSLVMDVLRRFGEIALTDLNSFAGKDFPLEIRVAALRSLASIDSPRGPEIISTYCEDAEPLVRAEAIAALGITGSVEAQAKILSALDDGNAGVRLQAAKICSSLRLTKAAPRLTDMVRHDEWQARFHAAQALWSLGEGGIAILRDLADYGNTLAHDLLAEKAPPA